MTTNSTSRTDERVCPACHRAIETIEDHHGWCVEGLREIAEEADAGHCGNCGEPSGGCVKGLCIGADTIAEPCDKRTTARHEAGHVVAAILCGYVVTMVELIEYADGWEGATWPCPPPHVERIDPVVECVIAWGGTIAEGTAPMITESDAAPFDKHGLCERSIVMLRDYVTSMLAAHEPAIVAVAAALEAQEVLFAVDVARLCVDAMPELGDVVPDLPKDWPPMDGFREHFEAKGAPEPGDAPIRRPAIEALARLCL